MSLADEIRREAATNEVQPGRYACQGYGIPLEQEYDRRPECGESSTGPIEEVLTPEFAD